MVDELRDRINAAATRDASASGTLVLSDYHGNPSLKRCSGAPALKTSLTSLDPSYCLEIHGKPLEDLLTSLPNLRSPTSRAASCRTMAAPSSPSPSAPIQT